MAMQILATLRLPERTWLHVDPDDAKFSLNNYASGGTFSGRFKNLAVYSRPLRVLEAQTMTTRLPPTPLGIVDEDKKVQKQAEEEEEEEEEITSVGQYERLVSASRPEAYWPMVTE